MTTLNTIIEEEKKEFADKFPARNPDIEPAIRAFLTTAMQRAYEAGVEDGKATNVPNV